jgi:hypothetical protein
VDGGIRTPGFTDLQSVALDQLSHVHVNLTGT